MSLPNPLGIDPASANADVFKASGRLLGNMTKRGRTGQFVLAETQADQVDELAELGGD